MAGFWRRIGTGLIAAGLLFAAGCERRAAEDAQGPELQRRAADAPRAADEPASRFEYVRFSVDVTGAAPQACLVFTGALDPAADYSPYVRIEPEARVALAVDGRSLCIGGLTFGEEREITLMEGLPAADGRRLETSETARLDFGDRPAFVGFAGSGVILPRVDADGVALETVNIASVKVRVWRVSDRALAFRSVTQGISAAAGEYAWMDYDSDPQGVAVLVWEGEMDTPGPANAPVTTVFPIAEAIGRLQPGAYFIEARDSAADETDYRPHARARRWLMITDLALSSYSGASGIDVTVRSLQTAQVQRGARVELISRGNEILASRSTGADGRVRFDAPAVRGEGAAAPRLIAAYGDDGDFAVLDLDRAPVDLSANNISGRIAPAGADAYAYLDRGIYRPGETVRASILLRDTEARAIGDRSGSLVIYGPNGIEAHRTRFERADDAGAVFLDYETPRAAARGIWRLAVELDGLGAVGGTRFSVEDFVPQRIALTLRADTETPMRADERRGIEADVRFLYGAPGAGLPLELEARIERDPNPFPAQAGFRFGRHDEQFREISLDPPDAVADGAGRAQLYVGLEGEGRDSSLPLRVRAVVSAIEPGGRAVRDDLRIPYRPRDLYVGVRPMFDDGRVNRGSSAAFDAIAVNRAGNQREARLNWRLIRNDWTYDWYREEGGDWRWRRTRRTVLIEDGVVRAGAEPARIATRNLDWGDYTLILTDEETGAEASHNFWAGWGAAPVDGVEAPDRVRLSGPAAPPAVGREAQIAIVSPYAGEAEVVVATDRVISVRSISVPEGGAEISLPVTADWGPGAWVMVTVFTPRDAATQPRPRRAVGVIHVPVDVSARRLDLTLDVPERIRPRQTLRIPVQAEGRARAGAYVTLAAVDEGILQLTRFVSPDPADWYFGRKRLGVDLRDDYGRLLDPNQGAAAEVRSGGDMIGAAGLTVVPTRTVALFSGPVRLDRNGRAVIELDIPDFNGELRLMAVAWSGDALGAHAQPLTVRDTVPAELILPRFMAPGDAATATVSLDNVEGAPGDYSVRVTGDGPVSAQAAPLSLSLAQGQRRDAAAQITAGETGVGAFGLAVEGPQGFAVSRSYDIEVRSPWLPASYVDRALIRPGESYAPPGDALASFIPGSSRLTVSFSAIPMDAAALYESLSRYPYGCSEQILSRAMPLLYADQMAALAGLARDGSARREVQDAVASVLNRQDSDGAFGLWRVGDQGANAWIGAYTVDFLARAQARGVPVPEAALNRAYDVMMHVARGDYWRAHGYRTDPWGRSAEAREAQSRVNENASAYAMYVLARAGRVDRARLRYMHDQQLSGIRSPLARAHIGAALAMIGDRARSANAFGLAEAALGYNDRHDYYQTARRDLAGVLALAAEAGEEAIVERLVARIGRDLPEPDRLTTQEKAFLLLAAAAIAGDQEALSIEMTGAAETLAAGRSFALDADALASGARFVNQGDRPVWRTTVARGAPASAPPPAAEGLEIAKDIRRTDGGQARLDALNQGDRLVIAITLTPKERRRIPAVIADLLPAGFEIEAVLRPEDAGDTGPYAWLGQLASPSVAEARDDRFIAAIDLSDGRAVRLAYVVRAVTPGRFAVPGAVAEDMYDPAVFARSAPGEAVIGGR